MFALHSMAWGRSAFHCTLKPTMFRLCPKQLTKCWNRQLRQRYLCFVSAKSCLPSFTHPSTNRRWCSTLSIFGHDPFDDYEKSRKQFSLTVPEYFNFATDVIDRWACMEEEGKRSRSNPALWWIDDRGQEVKWSFQQLSQYSKKVANILSIDCRLQPKDRMIVILPRVLPWWLLNLAAIRAGVVLSPGTTLLTPKDISHRLLSSQACCVVTDVNCAEAVDQVAEQSSYLKTKLLIGPETRPGWMSFNQQLDKASSDFQSPPTKSSDPMMLFFTSGTTGDPKMAEHSHASYGLGHMVTAVYAFGLTPTDVMWNLSDTGWAKAAWSSFFAPWINGACVFQQNTARFDPHATLEVLSRYPITLFCAPPTALRMMITQDLKKMKPKALRKCVSGGEPVNPEIIEEWRKGMGTDIYEAYGQTETTCLIATFPCIEQKPGSMGRVCPGVDIEVSTIPWLVCTKGVHTLD
ncbi:acyl-coenzyme A synthetase ACSM3, mitochondrial-like [Liolophura sinensis]|uniref:acyl-coenzyme A synthetase ACSM3, mitochondrial-like n=1 Tax=Liolophura sinensis TaxID=3198878 RepID=UPI00315896EB